MVQRTQVMLIDDVDGGDAAETVSFGLDGVMYEIDLSEKHAGKMRDVLAEWVGHARRTGGRTRTGQRAGAAGLAAGRREDLNAIREWGRENNYKVSDRGRVSKELQDAYDQAHA